jgi:hypothetical protein
VPDAGQPQTETLPKTPGTSAWVPVLSFGEAASAAPQWQRVSDPAGSNPTVVRWATPAANP